MQKPVSLSSIGKSAPTPRSAVLERQRFISDDNIEIYSDLFKTTLNLEEVSAKNCENMIGCVEIPVGVAGPLKIKNYSDHIFVPLATTEGALVASISRGCKAISLAGGADCAVEYNGITRAPVFACTSGNAAQALVTWITKNEPTLAQAGEHTSHHLKYLSHLSWIRGRQVFVRFAFDTDEAMGMNMATIATEAICQLILQNNTDTTLLSISSNVCTDKKDSVINSLLGRGYWAQAECRISEQVIAEVLKTTSRDLFRTHVAKNLVGSNLAGSFSQNGQVANVLAAIFLATGQDPAHVVDGSKAFLTVEPEDDGLYVALTLPNLLLGTVGGGTTLPAQTQARRLFLGGEPLLGEKPLLGGQKKNSSYFTQCVAAAALAGELSLLASLSVNTLAAAHRTLSRNQ